MEGASAASSGAEGVAVSVSMNSDGGERRSALSGVAAPPTPAAPPSGASENLVNIFKEKVASLDDSVHGKWLCLKSLESYPGGATAGRCRYASLAVQLGMNQKSLDDAVAAWLADDPRARKIFNSWVWPSTIGDIHITKAKVGANGVHRGMTSNLRSGEHVVALQSDWVFFGAVAPAVRVGSTHMGRGGVNRAGEPTLLYQLYHFGDGVGVSGAGTAEAAAETEAAQEVGTAEANVKAAKEAAAALRNTVLDREERASAAAAPPSAAAAPPSAAAAPPSAKPGDDDNDNGDGGDAVPPPPSAAAELRVEQMQHWAGVYEEFVRGRVRRGEESVCDELRWLLGQGLLVRGGKRSAVVEALSRLAYAFGDVERSLVPGGGRASVLVYDESGVATGCDFAERADCWVPRALHLAMSFPSWLCPAVGRAVVRLLRSGQDAGVCAEYTFFRVGARAERARETPLQRAAGLGCPELVSLLLGAGADPVVPTWHTDGEGLPRRRRTALAVFGARCGLGLEQGRVPWEERGCPGERAWRVVSLLVDAKAVVDAVDDARNGVTPLLEAVVAGGGNAVYAVAAVDALVGHGADAGIEVRCCVRAARRSRPALSEGCVRAAVVFERRRPIWAPGRARGEGTRCTPPRLAGPRCWCALSSGLRSMRRCSAVRGTFGCLCTPRRATRSLWTLRALSTASRRCTRRALGGSTTWWTAWSELAPASLFYRRMGGKRSIMPPRLGAARPWPCCSGPSQAWTLGSRMLGGRRR